MWGSHPMPAGYGALTPAFFAGMEADVDVRDQ
jgi:hypothetical protein